MRRTPISEAKAVTIGLMVVNGPVILLMFGPGFLLVSIAPDTRAWIMISTILGSWILAWLRWSVSVPKWRLWAYERVDDITELKRRSVSAGLTWPDGHFFERTEIKSRAHAAMEKSLEREKFRNGNQE